MAVRSSSVYVRIEPDIKAQAENVLDQLGLPMSNAIALFLRQVILHNGLPFPVALPKGKPVFFNELNEEQIDIELGKGLADVLTGNVIPAEEVTESLSREFNL